MFLTPGTRAGRSRAPIGFKANFGGVDQTAVNANYTKMAMTTEVFDIGNFYDASHSKWIPPAGLVLISAQIVFEPDPAAVAAGALTQGDAVVAAIYKNGSLLAQGINIVNDVFGIGTFGFPQAVVADNSSGADVYELYAFVNAHVVGTKNIQGNALNSYWSGALI